MAEQTRVSEVLQNWWIDFLYVVYTLSRFKFLLKHIIPEGTSWARLHTRSTSKSDVPAKSMETDRFSTAETEIKVRIIINGQDYGRRQEIDGKC